MQDPSDMVLISMVSLYVCLFGTELYLICWDIIPIPLVLTLGVVTFIFLFSLFLLILISYGLDLVAFYFIAYLLHQFQVGVIEPIDFIVEFDDIELFCSIGLTHIGVTQDIVFKD